MNGRWLTILLTAGCGSTDPDVSGGTEDQRAVVRAVLEEFDAASSFFPKLAGIDLRPFDTAEGRYSRVARTIVLDDRVALDTLRRNARHEVCHAYDFQFPFDSNDVTDWGETNRDRREAFAGFCQVGPEAIGSILDCGRNLYDAQGARMAEELFDRVEAPRDLGGPESVGSLGLEAGVELRDVLATEDGIIVLATSEGVTLIQRDGSPLPPGTEPGVVPPFATDPTEAVDHWGFRDAPLRTERGFVGIADWSIGSELALSQVLEVEEDRVVGAACAGRDDALFTLDGQVWQAWVADGVVHWGPLISL